MKTKFCLMLIFLVLLVSVAACRFYNPLKGGSVSENRNSPTSKSDDKSTPEKTIDSTDDEDKIGIPECDEVIDFFAEQAKSKDDNYVTKAAREYALNKVRESFKQSIEENKGDPAKMAKECRDFKKQLDKYKAEEDSNKQ